MPYRLGIDLGTTFTAAAICRPAPDGTVCSEPIPLGARAHSVPTVLFLGGGTTLVGEAAERRALTDPGRVVRDFKRRLGDETPIMVGGAPHQAQALAAQLVRWVVDRVTEREGEAPDAIAVTHPASWGPHRSTLLVDALADAGIHDVLLLSEPQAAALQYSSMARVEAGSTIAVYDLGGGTFDAAVVHKTLSGDFELLGPPEGIERLGGIDFDDAILSHVLTGVPPFDPDDPVQCAAMARLRRECTEAKETLSEDTEATVAVLLPDTRAQVRVDRPFFESMIRPVLEETVRSLQRAIQAAGVDADEVTSVLLVGGSSRIPLVTALISAQLGRPVAVDADPKGVVALGAALAAHRSMLAEPDSADVVVPAPRRPEHDCAPPELTRPHRRMPRTKIILGTLAMLLLALAVMPSPFSSDSDTSSPPRSGGQPARADTPGSPSGGSGSGPTTRKRNGSQGNSTDRPPGTSSPDDPDAAASGHKPSAPGDPSSPAGDPRSPGSSEPIAETAGISENADPPPEPTTSEEVPPPPPPPAEESTQDLPPPPPPPPAEETTPPAPAEETPPPEPASEPATAPPAPETP